MATTIENLKIELLTKALYETGNGDKVEEINKKLLEYMYKGKLQEDKNKSKGGKNN